MRQIFSKKSKTKGPDKAYPICMDSIQGTEGPKKDWDEEADDKFDRCVEKVKKDDSEEKDLKEAKKKKKDPCWKGYEQVGMKKKDGKEVPNCVPKKKSNSYFSVFKSAENGQQYDLQDDGLAEKMQQFEQLVATHDLTYQHSDNPRTYSKGRQQYQKIRDLAQQLPEDDAKRIWNAYVEKRLVPDVRDMFYWR